MRVILTRLRLRWAFKLHHLENNNIAKIFSYCNRTSISDISTFRTCAFARRIRDDLVDLRCIHLQGLLATPSCPVVDFGYTAPNDLRFFYNARRFLGIHDPSFLDPCAPEGVIPGDDIFNYIPSENSNESERTLTQASVEYYLRLKDEYVRTQGMDNIVDLTACRMDYFHQLRIQREKQQKAERDERKKRRREESLKCASVDLANKRAIVDFYGSPELSLWVNSMHKLPSLMDNFIQISGPDPILGLSFQQFDFKAKHLVTSLFTRAAFSVGSFIRCRIPKGSGSGFDWFFGIVLAVNSFSKTFVVLCGGDRRLHFDVKVEDLEVIHHSYVGPFCGGKCIAVTSKNIPCKSSAWSSNDPLVKEAFPVCRTHFSWFYDNYVKDVPGNGISCDDNEALR